MPRPLSLAAVAAVAVVSLALPLQAQGQAQEPDRLAPPGGWVAPLETDHPLVGRIWNTREGRFVSAEEAFAAVAAARFVLLGEKHDNPDHHHLQARFVAEMGQRGRRPVVAWEMFDHAQADALASWLAAHPDDAAGLGAAVGWERTGWPAWEIYQPVAAAALAAGMPLATANLPADQVRALARDGAAALPDDLRAALALPEPLVEGLAGGLPAPVAQVLRTAVVEGHCGLMPETMAEPMMRVQAARDAVMARALLDGGAGSGRDGGVLIAGNGHVRTDAGVPWHLARLGAVGQADWLAVAMVEVSAGAGQPADYAARYWADQVPFDLVVFTPLLDASDPCAAMRAHMERAARHKAEPPAESAPAQ